MHVLKNTYTRKVKKMKDFVKIIVIVSSIIINLVINGFVFLKLWEWFVVPTFELTVLNLPAAMGIALLIRYATMHDLKTSKKSADGQHFWDQYISNEITVIIFSTAIYGSAWVMQLFM